MLSRPQLYALFSAVIFVLGLSLAGCNRQKKVDEGMTNPADVKVEEVDSDGALQVDHPEQFLLASVKEQPTTDELRVTGTVAPDVNRSIPVLSMAGGRVEEIRAKLGDEVSKGQILLVINSSDVSQAFSDYQKAQADEALARQQLNRTQDLFSHGAAPQQDLETAENAEKKAQVDVRTAQQHVTLLGADINNPSPLISIRAPISGSIVEQNVTSTAGVRSLDNSPNLFTIANLSTVWLLCDVFENDLYRVHVGDSAEVRLNSFPDRAFSGRVGNISTVLDPATRSAKVRLELANSGDLMRAGMFATATFRSRTARLQPTVPTSAILRLHDKDWVFVPVDGNRFRRVQVQTSPSGSSEDQVILNGLPPGGKVIANALQFASAAGME